MDFEPASERTRLHREAHLGSHDPELIRSIIDAAPMCHLGLTDHDGHPLVIPTIHARVGEVLYVHGSAASRTLRRLAEGIEVCCTITHLDGILLARSTFWSTMNYRSVMIFGRARLVTDPEEIERALDAIVEHIAPGRSAEVRHPTSTEVKATKVLALTIDEASAKVRTGDPDDDPADLDSDVGADVWAGVIPVTTQLGSPIPAANLDSEVPIPASVRGLLERDER
jgi:nitroimidazol reductase NimA-like FMN-containing flavoprotein (pyridoxamine 5'-phosphate oxidase superfamily)